MVLFLSFNDHGLLLWGIEPYFFERVLHHFGCMYQSHQVWLSGTWIIKYVGRGVVHITLLPDASLGCIYPRLHNLRAPSTKWLYVCGSMRISVGRFVPGNHWVLPECICLSNLRTLQVWNLLLRLCEMNNWTSAFDGCNYPFLPTRFSLYVLSHLQSYQLYGTTSHDHPH